ncbi:unnamed protein product [Caenorhabditis bovis]|uniref:Transporter n=1 Tax=Caenorhabditis bovis TaxID=2654633 RepID=A0A8S1EPF8_9PELO|nr:unnamed protein product [Caenorhabditis bovis]
MSITSADAAVRHDKGAKKEQVDYSLYPPFIKQLDAKLPDYTREGDIEYPFEETTGIGDENRIRGNWSNKSDYILALIGFTAGVGSFWKFPFLIFQNGGAAFLVPYLVMLILAAMPVFFTELVLGQFSSLAAISVWKVVPMFKGIGYAQVTFSGFFAIFFNVISAWALFYLINSFCFSIPWSNCANSWSGENCTLGTRIQCMEMNGTLLVNGSCYVEQSYMNDSNVIPLHDLDSIPSLKYFHSDVLMLSNGVDDFGALNWYLGLCVLVCWIAVFLCLFQGVKSSGKVVYVSVILPFIIITVLLTRLLTLDGSFQAIIHFMNPNWKVLKDLKVWGEAAVQAFYSVSCCSGGLYTISSYNRFHNNIYRDISLVLTIDVIVSLIGCVLTFSAIGFTCFEFAISLDKFHIRDGFHLVFVFLAEALAGVPVAPLYAGLFFIMVLLVVHATQMFVVETIVSSLCDEHPERLRRNRRHVLTTVCALFILLSIPFCLSSGLYWMEILSQLVLTWPLLVIAFLECMAINWIYGVDNLLDNAKWIVGHWPPCYILWKILFKFVCPLVYLSILCFLWLDWRAISYESYEFPYWSIVVGWSLGAIPLLMIPVVAVWQYCIAKGNITQKWWKILYPDDAWGPALAIHRAEKFPLQIPEARRLLLPPEVEIVGNREGQILQNDEDYDVGGARSSDYGGDARSLRSTVIGNEWPWKHLKTSGKTITEDFHNLEKIHDEYVHKMRELGNVQTASTKALKHHNYLMKGVAELIRKAEKEIEGMPNEPTADGTESLKDTSAGKVDRIKQEIELSRVKLRDMQAELPAQDKGFYLNLILGSNLNVSLLTKCERFKYKKEYEDFKYKITVVITVLTAISFLFPYRVLDMILCFVMVWYYCTLTIRESVLCVNGSRIKGWWLTHHYLSCAVPGIILTWKEGECYQEFRLYFIAFITYISLVQLAQNQYQQGCLRRLHALGQGHQMDITVEGFTSWQFKGLTFLLPFLMGGYIFQLFLTIKLYFAAYWEICDGIWQIPALSVLLGIIGGGNLITTSMVCFKKFKTTPSYANIVTLTRKYSSRHRMRDEAKNSADKSN